MGPGRSYTGEAPHCQDLCWQCHERGMYSIVFVSIVCAHEHEIPLHNPGEDRAFQFCFTGVRTKPRTNDRYDHPPPSRSS